MRGRSALLWKTKGAPRPRYNHALVTDEDNAAQDGSSKQSINEKKARPRNGFCKLHAFYSMFHFLPDCGYHPLDSGESRPCRNLQ